MDELLMIGLIRVSTGKQAESGLGLEAQAAAIEQHRARYGGNLLETYQEIESGKHNDINKRPKLREAAEHAKEADAVLVIAKLDRLVRSTSVLHYLKSVGVRFIACDNPHANEMTIDILVAVAAGEARMISQRTKDALAAYKAGGRVSKRLRALHPDGVPPAIAEATAGKLGASLAQCRNLTDDGRALGRDRAIEARRVRSTERARAIGRLVEEWLALEPGLTLLAIADRLNRKKRRTPNGMAWGPGQVKRVIDKLKLRPKPA